MQKDQFPKMRHYARFSQIGSQTVDFHEIYLHFYLSSTIDARAPRPLLNQNSLAFYHSIDLLKIFKIDRECMEIVIFIFS